MNDPYFGIPDVLYIDFEDYICFLMLLDPSITREKAVEMAKQQQKRDWLTNHKN